MGSRVRVTLSFVVSADRPFLPEFKSLLDGFEGAVRGLWPGLECDIEPNGRAKFQQMRLANGKPKTPKKTVRKADGSWRDVR